MKKYSNNPYIDYIDQWDKRIILKYNKFGNKYFQYFLKTVSFFGRSTVWMFLTAFFIFLWYDPYLSGYIGITFINGIWMNMFIKTAINRKRPFESLNGIVIFEPRPHSRSFPSWHAYNGVSQAIILAYLGDSPLFLVLLTIFSVLIGFSRIKLGVHYPSDVIAGFILGIIGAIITITFLGPLSVLILKNIEPLILFEIHYRRLNPMLENIWYVLACILIFGLILLPVIIKYLRKEQ